MEGDFLKKNVIVFIIIIIIILGIIFVPKYFRAGDGKVRFKTVEKEEIPQKIVDILPNYLADERALGCKVEDEVFVVVTRGEKNTGGYLVTIDRIEKKKVSKDEYNLTVYAVFKDPKPDEIVAQKISYPFVIAKTDLDKLPNTIQLEILYEE